MALKVILYIRINGKKYRADELPEEKVAEILKERVDRALVGLPFERIKSA